MDERPGGPAAKLQPSPGGLGINPEDDSSAVGAALNLGLLAPVSIPSEAEGSAVRPIPSSIFGVGHHQRGRLYGPAAEQPRDRQDGDDVG